MTAHHCPLSQAMPTRRWPDPRTDSTNRSDRRFAFALFILAVVGLQPAVVSATDFFLTVGGGYSPAANQISLERNVQFFQRVLAEHRPDAPSHTILFADGTAADRDLQYRDLERATPPVVASLAEVFGRPRNLTLAYRNHEVAGVAGPARTLGLRREIVRLSRQMQAGDRLFLYVTAHGGEAEDEETPQNCVLHLWDDDEITVAEWTKLLDRLPESVSVVMVMVQCYSGGFAHAMFDRGDAELGLSPQRRCGFFSQVHDRPAAGCTPDMDEENYREYSTYFFAALSGRARDGTPIDRVDYDGDGQTSLAEAHAYTLIHSDTIDIPLRTSDEFLRRYSRVGKRDAEDASEEESRRESTIARVFRELTEDPRPPAKAKLLPLAGTIAELSELADPIDRAVLRDLAEQLGMEAEMELSEIGFRVKRAKRKMEREESELGAAATRYARVRSELRDEVLREWPELRTAISPTMANLLDADASRFVEYVEGLSDFRVTKKARAALEEALEESLAADRLEAKTRRLQRVARRIILAQNLRRLASDEIVRHYEQLLELENSFLHCPTTNSADAALAPDAAAEIPAAIESP